jgi:virginiamycin B lyase
MRRRSFLQLGLAAVAAPSLAARAVRAQETPFKVSYFDIPAIQGSRDVTPAGSGRVWVCGQRNGTLGLFDPADGALKVIALGDGAAPHGVISDKDGAAWVTEGGQNAIARIDPVSLKVDLFRLPAARANANLNTAVFDHSGVLWFTGQNGIYGRFDPKTTRMDVFDAPRGPGPYGMTRTPAGEIWYASLAGNHIARIDTASGGATVVEPPTRGQGARRIWSDSRGHLWISEWNSGQVSVHDPAAGTWRSWKLPGTRPRTYSVYVDERDKVWLTDFAANAIVRFDPATEAFTSFASTKSGANVRQMDGRAGEVWGGESGQNRLVRIQTTTPA